MQPQEQKPSHDQKTHSAPQNAVPVPTVSSSSKAAQKSKMYLIIIVVLGVVALFLLILVFVFSSKSSTTQQNLNTQYQNGVSDGSKQQKTADEKAFQDQQGSDFRVYTAPDAYGAFQLSLPKTWSWVITPGGANGTFAGQSDPDYVNSTSTVHAFTFNIVDQSYDKVKKDYDSKAKGSGGAIKTADITVSGIQGTSYTGKFDKKSTINSEVVIVPVREKTVVFRSDDIDRFGNTFNHILANAKINP